MFFDKERNLKSHVAPLFMSMYYEHLEQSIFTWKRGHLVLALFASMKLSKPHLHKIRQSGGFPGRLLEPLLKIGFPLIENVLKALAKSVLISLGLTAASSATDAAIHKKIFGSGIITLMISNEKMNDIMKIVQSLEESGLLIKGVSERIKNEAKEQKRRFC